MFGSGTGNREEIVFTPKVDDVTTLLLQQKQHIKCVIAIYLEVQIMESFSNWNGEVYTL